MAVRTIGRENIAVTARQVREVAIVAGRNAEQFSMTETHGGPRVLVMAANTIVARC